MTGLGAFGIHLRFGNWRRRGDGERRRRGTLGGIMWGIVILIGTARYCDVRGGGLTDGRMLKAIYTAVDKWIRGYQVRLETAILEVDPEGE